MVETLKKSILLHCVVSRPPKSVRVDSIRHSRLIIGFYPLSLSCLAYLYFQIVDHPVQSLSLGSLFFFEGRKPEFQITVLLQQGGMGRGRRRCGVKRASNGSEGRVRGSQVVILLRAGSNDGWKHGSRWRRVLVQ